MGGTGRGTPPIGDGSWLSAFEGEQLCRRTPVSDALSGPLKGLHRVERSIGTWDQPSGQSVVSHLDCAGTLGTLVPLEKLRDRDPSEVMSPSLWGLLRQPGYSEGLFPVIEKGGK